MKQLVTKLINFFTSIIFESLFPNSQSDQILLSMTKEKAYTDLPRAPATPYQFIRSIFAYKNDLVTSLIWNIKYKKSAKALEIGGYALYQYIADNFDFNSVKVILIPIPISHRRRNERGFNQCELLLNEVQKIDKNINLVFSFGLIKRKIHQDRQTLKKRSSRIEDAKNIFEIDSPELEKLKSSTRQINKQVKIIIIDDVVTTGSTMREAVELIKSVGFEDVSGISLAH